MTVTLLTVASLSSSGAIDLDELANAAGRPIGRGEIQRITFDESLVFAWQWGGLGDAKGKFAFPLDAAVDLDGNVYVTDHENWRVQKFTSSGDFVAEIRASGKPWGATIDRAGNLFVIVNPISEGWSAKYRGTLIKYDRRGARTSWAAKGPDGRLPDGWDPRGIATDRDGNVYVANADDGARDVKKYDPNGKFLLSWSPQDARTSAAQAPHSLAVDASGVVFVANGGSGARRVQRFNSNGGWLGTWDRPFDGASGIATDSRGVYVVNGGLDRVQLLTKEGQLITEWGGRGIGPGKFDQPTGIAIDARGDIYVVDTFNHRVQKFRFGLPDRVFGDPMFEVRASASSGLPVTFSTEGPCISVGVSPGVALVDLRGLGRCTVVASQAGGGRFASARAVRSFDIHADRN